MIAAVRPIILATRKSSRDEAEVWSDLGDGQPPLRCFLHSFLISLGIVSPSPACRRTLEWVCDALEKQGHEVVDLCARTALILS
jgi:hypothetical protein